MQILAIIIVVAFISACSPTAGVKNSRVNFHQGVITKQDGRLASPLLTSVENSSTEACTRLAELSRLARAGDEAFSLFSAISPEAATVNVGENPFVQFILGEKFRMSSEEEFYQRAREEYQAGNLSGWSWFFVKVLRFFGAVSLAQYPATNGALNEMFPGIFGSPGPVKNALFYKLAMNAAGTDALSSLMLASISRRLPLFAGESWQDFAEDTRLSLSAAVSSLRSANHETKTCGLVLLQRGFAQLLAIKGYRAPITEAYNSIHVVKKIEDPITEFPGYERAGAFLNSAGRPVVLSPETLQTYDPTQSLLRARKTVPTEGASSEPGRLTDALAMMEGMLFHFEATSPASPWIESKNDYFLGDILAAGGKALLPYEANSLALGLLTLHFKNLAAMHIQQVNARGVLAREGETVAGLVLNENPSDILAEVRLDSVLRLARITAYLEGALARFTKRTVDEWADFNPAFDPNLLNALLGTKENPGLRDQLIRLRLPLAILLGKFADEDSCFVRLQWDLRSGDRSAQTPCSARERQELADVLEVLARSAQAPVLMRKADFLRAR